MALVIAALRYTLGNEFVTKKLSMYYLTLEVAQVTRGMEIAIPEEDWRIFRNFSADEFRATLLELASQLEPERYIKHKRGPKKPQPKKTSGKRHKHLCTARVLAARG